MNTEEVFKLMFSELMLGFIFWVTWGVLNFS